MKNTIILLGLTLVLLSCGSSSSYKYNYEEESKLKGVWIVQNVEYSMDKIKVTAFGVADAQCFKGSVWTLIPNNHTGKITEGASNSDCPYINTDLTWYIDSNDTFNTKVISPGEKAKDVKDGFQFKYNRTSENSFQIIQSAALDGQPIYITYNFIKQ